mgnify:CR=1 FL=1
MLDIYPGYEVVHSTYGKGIVTEVDQYITVKFGSESIKKFQKSWIWGNCQISVPKDGNVKYLQEKIDKFKRFSLSDQSIQEIENFFRFKLNCMLHDAKSLRYNLLIECENNADSQEILKEFKLVLQQLDKNLDECYICTEGSLSKSIPAGFPLFYSMLGIYDCTSIRKDSVSITSSAIRSSIQLDKEQKDQLWKKIRKKADRLPGCTIIAAGPKGFIDYIRESDELYYRFFAHHLYIRSMNVEEIIQEMYQRIKTEEFECSEQFKDDIEQYVRTVYPKADLRNTEFIEDLMNRIWVNYYLNPTGKVLTEECVPFYRKPKTFEEISKQLDQLIGLQSVKKQFRNIYNLSRDPMNVNKQRLHFSFVGNPGTGKTTIAKLTADLLYSMGLIKKNKLVMVAPTDIMSVYIGESAQLMKEKINEAKGGVLFIDEAYFLTSSMKDTNSRQKQCLEVLIQEMENHSDELSVIFAGYESEIDALLKSNPGIASRVPFKFIFEDYSDEELLQIFLKMAEEEGMSLEKDAYEKFYARIALARTDDNFGNARTVANLYQQLKMIWLDSGRKERVICADDIQKSMPKALHTDLNEMIGLDSVKKELNSFEARVKYIKYLQEKKMSVPAPNMHMMFTGNPGTGKTTVAKKIADCLYNIGILKTNKLVVAERKDLVDSYIGGTAIKTNELIRKAMNGVLFIDEAYSLYRPDDSKDFGTEALATLITAMEEHKDSLVIIFAGYRKEMQTFQNANPGIASRIGFTFHFPDYTPSELVQIFSKKMNQNGFVVDSKALTSVLKLMEYFSEMKDFGNGRFVDKVIDMVINNRAGRAYSRRYNDVSEKDIPEIKDMIRISSNGQNLWIDEYQSKELKRVIAVHETGHALVSKIVSPERKIKMVSINSDAGAMGKAVLENDTNVETERSMKAQLAILFAGRNAERLIFGDQSAGCYNDIAKAKERAAYMVNTLAMGEFGVTTATDLLIEADQLAAKVLLEHKDKLLEISELLLKKGVIGEEELTL